MFFLLICWQQSFWNLMLKREQKGLTNLLRRHGIDSVKEQSREQVSALHLSNSTARSCTKVY